MTVLAYGSPFQLLSTDEVQLIASSVEFRTAYIDCLAMLQGVVSPFASQVGLPAFGNSQLIEESLIATLDRLPPNVRYKMHANTITALELRHENVSPEIPKTLGLIKSVDDFLQAVVTQYHIVRSASPEMEPATKVMGVNAAG